MSGNKSRKPRISVGVTLQFKEAIDQAALRRHCTLADYVRWLLQEGLAKDLSQPLGEQTQYVIELEAADLRRLQKFGYRIEPCTS